MIKYVLVLSTLAVSTAFVMPAASAMTAAQIRECRAMGASLQVRQTETAKMAEDRAALLERVELAGDEWEAAEAVRNFGPTSAAEANATKAAYDGLKSDLIKKDMALQSAASMINGDVAAYNGRCTNK